MEDAPTLLKILQSQNIQILGYVYRNTIGPNHGPVRKIQSFLLKEICTVNLQAGPLCERQFEKVLLEYGWEKVPNWECLFFNREKKGQLLSVYVDDLKVAGKKQTISPTWQTQMKDVDLGVPTSFFDHVYLGCTQRECQISKDIVDNYRSMFGSRIAAGTTEKLPATKSTVKPDAETISSWFYDMEGHAKKCVERYCELANNTTQQ